jgi:hypothetical protein
VLCNQCAEYLPDDAKFCLKCGQAVGVVKVDAIPVRRPMVAAPGERPASKRRRSRTALLLLVMVLLIMGWWTATSTSTVAQQVREIASGAHTEAITEKTFSVNSRSFSSYKFSAPSGAVNVTVSGQFATKDAAGNEVQVYVLSDDAFVTWRNGYAISPYYDSGKVVQGNIHAELPVGQGTYYLVFNNNFSVKAAKTVQAEVSLRYNTWWPDWLFHVKDKLWGA